VSFLVAAVVASALAEGGGMAIALDDGTVWMVHDGEWEELGACDDGEVIALEAAGGRLLVECGDGSAWTWSDDAGWAPHVEVTSPAVDLELPVQRSWWPLLELSVRMRSRTEDDPVYEGWVRLRWDI
jgi:hypothetical protein